MMFWNKYNKEKREHDDKCAQLRREYAEKRSNLEIEYNLACRCPRCNEMFSVD
jgi:hypothetical protein